MYFITKTGSTYVVDQKNCTVSSAKIGTLKYQEGFKPVIMAGQRAYFPLVNGELKTSVVASVHA